ncbi:glycoside hydrolase family 36 N-terminal domain-containing protein [Streptomyces lydicus]|nr:glycoside hydrolase family 36 N-terminal domain-containing protein [Streptomyces lydicus]
MEDLLHFRAAGAGLVLDVSGNGLPRVVHWGADLGECGPGGLAGLRTADVAQTVSNALDEPVPLSVLPQQSAGWPGTPGVAGHRAGSAAAPAFTTRARTVDAGQRRLTVTAVDADGGLALTLETELTGAGLVRLRAEVTNTGVDGYHLTELAPALPVPSHATEILDLTGRHLRERAPQRHAFTLGTHLRENRRGRTGSDATLLQIAGTAGFGFRSGEVWGCTSPGAATTARWPSAPRPGRPYWPAANCCCRARSCWRPARATARPGSTAPTGATAWTSWPAASTASCVPAPPTPPPRARSPSTPGRRSTSTRTWPR